MFQGQLRLQYAYRTLSCFELNASHGLMRLHAVPLSSSATISIGSDPRPLAYQAMVAPDRA